MNSQRILLVDSDEKRAETWGSALTSRGFDARSASGGVYALTLIERQQPDWLVTRQRLSDMSGPELCAAVKQDDSLSKVRVALATDRRQARRRAVEEGLFDRVLEEAEPAILAAHLNAVETPSGHSVTGTLEVLSFAELTQAFSQTRKTGLLTFEWADGSCGLMAFDDGLIIHAACGRVVGREAFARLFETSGRTTAARFRFEPGKVGAFRGAHDAIGQTAQELLLSAAVAIDEGGVGPPRRGRWSIQGSGRHRYREDRRRTMPGRPGPER